MSRILLPGSYDPFTIGHYYVAKRCVALFDEVYVVIFQNTKKSDSTMFSSAERLEMLQIALKGHPRVTADITDKLVVDYAKEHGISALAKGVRNTLDFEYELDLSIINRELTGIDTVLIPALPAYKHISSSVVRELIKYGRDFSDYVQKDVFAYITSKF